jgi:hypothetical protein
MHSNLDISATGNDTMVYKEYLRGSAENIQMIGAVI